MEYKSIGKNINRVEAFSKVTGRAKFTADLKFPGELFTYIVRSKEPHALIKNIDYNEALEVDGVKGIITGEDAVELVGVCIMDQPPIAHKKVRFVGEPVAVVVAKTKEIALLAGRKVKVEYEKLPALFETSDAMAKDAVLIHDSISTISGFLPEPDTNIFHHYKIRSGNVKEAFEKSNFKVSGTMHWPHLAHCQMEPHVTIAKWSSNNYLQIYTSAQSPCDVRHFIAEAFALPMNKIVVETYYVGGGFGGKSDVTIEPLTVFVAKHFPDNYIRIQLEREEVFNATVVGRGLDSEFCAAFDKDGIINGLKVKYVLNSGAYASYAINIVQPGGIVSSGTYYISNMQVDAYGVYTNKPPLGAYRAYGHPEAALVSEKVIDLIADKLNIDPIIVRERNLIKSGQKNSIGQIVRKDDGNIKACLDLVKKDIEPYKNSKSELPLVRGVGIANLLKAPGMPANGFSTAIVRFNEDTTVNVLIGGIDMGQGLLTAITQIASEALNIPMEKIEINHAPNTQFTPYEWQTVASRSTWMVGNAVYKAAQDAISQIKENAAIGLSQSVDDMVYDGEKVYYKFDCEEYVPLEKLMLGYSFPNGKTSGKPPVGYGAYMPEMEYPDPETGRGNCASQWTYGTQGVVLDVDINSGLIFVKMVSSALDIGKVINPIVARGQVEGAVCMGIGGTIMEEMLYGQSGNVRNCEFTDYKIPTPEDMIDIELKTHFVETHDNKMVYGAKCLGEHPIIGVAPAIISAVRDAIGLDFDILPLSPAVVRRKIRENYNQVMAYLGQSRE